MGSAFSQKNCFWIAGIRASNDPTTRPQGPCCASRGARANFTSAWSSLLAQSTRDASILGLDTELSATAGLVPAIHVPDAAIGAS